MTAPQDLKPPFTQEEIGDLYTVLADAGDLNERIYGGPNGEWRQGRLDRLARARAVLEKLEAWNHRAPQPAPPCEFVAKNMTLASDVDDVISDERINQIHEACISHDGSDQGPTSLLVADLVIEIERLRGSGFPPQVPATPRCSNCLWPAHDGPCGCLVHQKHTANCFACCSAAPDSRTAGRD